MYQVIGFEIFYDDWSIFTSKSGAWDIAPDHGVENIIVVFDGFTKWGTHHTAIVSCRDFYYLNNGLPTATNFLDETKGRILYGKWMTDEDFEINRLWAFRRANQIKLGEYGN